MTDLKRFFCITIGTLGLLLSLFSTDYLVVDGFILGLIGGTWFMLWVGIAAYKE